MENQALLPGGPVADTVELFTITHNLNTTCPAENPSFLYLKECLRQNSLIRVFHLS